jgi:hypothetical protein
MMIASRPDAETEMMMETVTVAEMSSPLYRNVFDQFSQAMRSRLPDDAEVLMMAIGVAGRDAQRLRDSVYAIQALLDHANSTTERKQLEKLVETLLPPMAPPRHVLLEANMLARAKKRILLSEEWLTAKEIARRGNFSASNASAQPNRWKREGRIFAISHNNVDYYPIYGLEEMAVKPLPAMKNVLDALQIPTPWEIAFWFDAANTFLDGRRPQEVIALEPDNVVAAAKEEASRGDNG